MWYRLGRPANMRTGILRLLMASSACAACASPHSPRMITVTVDEINPAFAAFRHDSDDWSQVTFDGTFQFSASDDFEFIVVCVSGDGGFDTEELAATVQDGTEWHIEALSASGSPAAGNCQPVSAPSGGSVHVTGTMLQPGSVTLGNQGEIGSTTNWHFDIQTVPGKGDLIAVSADESTVLIRRDQNIVDSFVEQNVDVTTGDQLVNMPITVAGVSIGDTVSSSVYVMTANRTEAMISNSMAMSSGETVDVDEKLIGVTFPTDTVSIIMSDLSTFSSGGFVSRTNVLNKHVASSAFSSIPAVTFENTASQATASWASEMNQLDADVCTVASQASPSGLRSLQHGHATAGWIRAHNPNSIILNTEVPNYDPAWRVELSAAHDRTLSLWHSDSDGTYSVTVGETNVTQ